MTKTLTVPWWFVEFDNDEIVYVGRYYLDPGPRPAVFDFGRSFCMKVICQAPTEERARAVATKHRDQHLAKEGT